MTDKIDVTMPKQLLEVQGLRAKKSWGQNFLRDQRALSTIAKTAAEPGLPMIEIGAGLGALTSYLAHTQLPLWAIERDRDLVPHLQQHFSAMPNVTIVEDNALTFEVEAITRSRGPFTLVGNLPYHISAPLLIRSFQTIDHYRRLVFMVQREVAERLVAPAGHKQRSSLSVWCELAGSADTVITLPPSSFFPQPKVHSTVVCIDLDVQSPLRTLPHAALEKLLRTAFGGRRKQLRNTMKALFGKATEHTLQACGVPPTARAETLHGEQWLALWKALVE